MKVLFLSVFFVLTTLCVEKASCDFAEDTQNYVDGLADNLKKAGKKFFAYIVDNSEAREFCEGKDDDIYDNPEDLACKTYYKCTGWEELKTCFPFYYYDPTTKTCSASYVCEKSLIYNN